MAVVPVQLRSRGTVAQHSATAQIAARYEPRVAMALENVWKSALSGIHASDIERALTEGGAQAVVAMLPIKRVGKQTASVLIPLYREAVKDGASFAMESLGLDLTKAVSLRSKLEPLTDPNGLGILPHDTVIAITIELVNEFAEEWAKEHAGQSINDFDLAQTVHDLVVEAQQNQITVRDLAQALRSVITLDARRAAALLKFALNALETSPEDVAYKRIARYSDALIRQRAWTIARTETIGAVNGGQMKAWRIAIQQELIRPQLMVKKWIVTDDELLCPICEGMDGDTVEIEAVFSAGVEAPPAHPNCRCAIGLVRR